MKAKLMDEQRRQLDPANLMAPPLDPDQAKKLFKNPYAHRMLGSEIEMLKLAKKQKEEEE